MQTGIDQLWTLLCIGLVFLMQPGFLALESGLTRSKNSINVAIKNLTDFSVSFALFWVIGFTLMFGASNYGLFGGNSAGLFSGIDDQQFLFFLFQAMFCGTAATIVSGAVAERMSFRGYITVTIVLSALIYPVFGHWAWGGYEGGVTRGWLAQNGYVDFAGTSVVHSTGAWVALAAIIILGPRMGRFNADGSHNPIPGNNLPLSMVGVLLLWLGWIGFNGGSAGGLTPDVPKIILNTFLAGVSGFVTALVVAWQIKKYPHCGTLMNGVLAGLVAITACCNAVSSGEAILIGAIGTLFMLAVDSLLVKCRLDDVVGVVAVHGGAGVWGTVAVALFADSDVLQTGLSFERQLAVQLVGILVNFIWAFGVAYAVLRLIDRLLPMRISIEDEVTGLNVTEHRASNEIQTLVETLDLQARTENLDLRVPADPYTEAGQIARRYNKILDMLQAALLKASDANKAKSEFLANMSHEMRTPLNAVIGFSELLKEAHLSRKERSYVGLIHKSGSNLLSLINGILDLSKIESGYLSLDPETMNLHELVDDIGQSLAYSAREKGIQLKVRYAATLPEQVIGDPHRIRQMLLNLVGNAIKFTEKGYVLIYVDGEVAENSVRVKFHVNDTGIGMTDEQCLVVFDQFTQADASTTRQYGGTGLGLSITKQLVELMGGEISVTSDVGVGSQFTVLLELPPGEENNAVNAGGLSQMKILCLSNDEIDQLIMKDLIARYGGSHYGVDSVTELLKIIRHDSKNEIDPDCVIVDIDTLGNKWRAALEKVSSALVSASIPFITLSCAIDRAGSGENGPATGCEWLEKPLVGSSLRDALSDVARRKIRHDPEKGGSIPASGTSEGLNFDIDTLVVDDDRVNQMLSKSLLKKLGCRVDIASNGKEALSKATTRRYDVIFMDCMMPEMNGYEATCELRKLEANDGATHRTVIAMTANNMKGDRERCLSAGMDDFVAKPVTISSLVEILDKYRTTGGET